MLLHDLAVQRKAAPVASCLLLRGWPARVLRHWPASHASKSPPVARSRTLAGAAAAAAGGLWRAMTALCMTS